jgi:integrase
MKKCTVTKTTKKDSKQPSAQKRIEKFAKWLDVNGYAYNTREAYIQRIRHFLDTVNGDITADSVEDYFLGLKKKYTNKTINCYRDAVSTFIRFEEKDIRIPKKLPEERTIPDAITREDFEDRIMPTADWTFRHKRTRYKARAIFYLIFYTGLRPSEIEALRRENIDLENLEGKYFNKKKNEWFVFVFNEKVRIILEQYFCLEKQKKNAFNVTRSAINKMCDRLKRDFPGIRLRPYLYRHSSATMLMRQGFNLLEIKNFLGHNSTKSTERYVKLDNAEFKKKYLERIE